MPMEASYSALSGVAPLASMSCSISLLLLVGESEDSGPFSSRLLASSFLRVSVAAISSVLLLNRYFSRALAVE